ncbi:Protein HESO1 [Bienertia sinuspersici]
MAAKMQEVLGLQTNKVLLSQLSAFQILLDDVYEITRPSFEDYAHRRDLIHKVNDIAREIYGDNDKCPVVENFGSFLMDVFNAGSDLDLSINFSDQFETDRNAKRRILKKFAKKFFALRSKGHVTTVERICSVKARVPVLKVIYSGSTVKCDFSVGNKDGIAKSHILFMISAIDERFRQLSFMMKAWAKAHDINGSKKGALKSLSLMLLAAFHLQLWTFGGPAFKEVGADGIILPLWKHYGRGGFVLALTRGRGSIETRKQLVIEDFTDRSQYTTRTMDSKKMMKKIYISIHHSLELIQSFTEGKIDATQLKNLLFGLGPPAKTVIPNLNYSEPPKPVCSNPSQKIKKRSAQGGPAEGQRPGKQGKHVYNPCSMEAPAKATSTTRVKNKRSSSGRKSDPVSSDTPTSVQGLDKLQETPIPNPSQKRKKFPTQRILAEGQRHTLTSFQGSGKSQEALNGSNQPFPVLATHGSRGSGASGPERDHVRNLNHIASSSPVIERSSLSDPLDVQCEGYGPRNTYVDSSSYAASRFPDAHPAFIASPEGSRGFRDAAHNLLLHEPLPFSGYGRFSHQHFQDNGGYRSERYHVETSIHAPNFPEVPWLSVSNKPVQRSAGLLPRRHVDTPNYSASDGQSPVNLAEGLGSERTRLKLPIITLRIINCLHTESCVPMNLIFLLPLIENLLAF